MSGFRIKDYNLEDTIAAIATFPAKSALGVIKLSGKKALGITSRIFKPARKKNLRKVKTHTLHYGWIVDKKRKKDEGKRMKEKGERGEVSIVDEVMVGVMRRPHSYTREDVVEISSHGGPAVLRKILELALKEGARPAQPGEFTYRALLSGRIDLLQAESILSLVEATTESSLQIAAAQLSGEASKKVTQIKAALKELFILTESAINFPEEDTAVPLRRLTTEIERIAAATDKLLAGSHRAKVIREGFRCVICGKANAGKSTLFNRLLKEERVIVSEVGGTTRDVIEETIDIRGVPLRIYDTAGILEPKDLVAEQAVKKTARTFESADLVILILDASRPLDKNDRFLLDKHQDKNVILVVNKMDVARPAVLRAIERIKGRKVKLSALKNIGLGNLEKTVYNSIYRRGPDRANVIFLSLQQEEILRKLKDRLRQTGLFLKDGQGLDFINFSLKECLDDLARLYGEVVSEEILESIFSRFCIGK